MRLVLESDNIEDYLAPSEIIDFEDDAIAGLAKRLSDGAKSDVEIARAVFEYVRDEIAHSFDVGGVTVTSRASDVLRYGEGICYTKAHLFAAIMRSLKIPTGFCYQKLTTTTDPPRRFLHGLNAIYLESLGRWVKLDPRGNKEGVSSEFDIDDEEKMLAFAPGEGVVDYETVYVVPNANCRAALEGSATLAELNANLPNEL